MLGSLDDETICFCGRRSTWTNLNIKVGILVYKMRDPGYLCLDHYALDHCRKYIDQDLHTGHPDSWRFQLLM